MLLRVQTHILVRDVRRMGDQDQPEEDIFVGLLESTYSHLLGAGVSGLATHVKEVMGARLQKGDWNVESRMNVEFEEVEEFWGLLLVGMEGAEGMGSARCCTDCCTLWSTPLPQPRSHPPRRDACTTRRRGRINGLRKRDRHRVCSPFCINR